MWIAHCPDNMFGIVNGKNLGAESWRRVHVVGRLSVALCNSLFIYPRGVTLRGRKPL